MKPRVLKHMRSDGTFSYEWTAWTPADLEAVLAAADQPAWIEANAVVTVVPAPAV